MATQRLQGKTILITGANAGIGKECAVALASQGARIVMVCRNLEKGTQAQQEIQSRSGSERIDLMQADVSSQASLREFSTAYKQRYDRLDVLLNNAGAIMPTRNLTVDGLESTFATNHLGYFLLTGLLLDILKESAPARIVNVSSEGHRMGRIPFADLQCERGYQSMLVYCNSKLANILFTYELVHRLRGSRVTANCLHPGAIASNFAHDSRGWFRMMMRLSQPFLLTSEQGAQTSIYLASSPEVEGVSGKYFVKKRAVASAPQSYNTKVAQQLWEVSETLTQFSY